MLFSANVCCRGECKTQYNGVGVIVVVSDILVIRMPQGYPWDITVLHGQRLLCSLVILAFPNLMGRSRKLETFLRLFFGRFYHAKKKANKTKQNSVPSGTMTKPTCFGLCFPPTEGCFLGENFYLGRSVSDFVFVCSFKSMRFASLILHWRLPKYYRTNKKRINNILKFYCYLNL